MIAQHECPPLAEFCQARLEAAVWRHAESPERWFEMVQADASDPITAIEDWVGETVATAQREAWACVPLRLMRANHEMAAWCDAQRASAEIPFVRPRPRRPVQVEAL